MTRSRLLVPVLALALLDAASSAGAQLRPRREAARQRTGAPQLPNEQSERNRAQLEQRFRQMLYQMTRRRVGLTDAQMNQLVPINQRFETQRRAVQRQERQTRLALREALRDSTHADQTQVAGYLDKLVQLQRQRIELVEQEQRDLSQFMTPVQRARYTALQEQVRRRIEQMVRQNRRATDTSAGPGTEPG